MTKTISLDAVKFKPLRNNILVKPLQRLQSEIIEVVSHERLNRGLVVAAGEGRYWSDDRRSYSPNEVKVGDLIAYGEFEYTKHYENDIMYLCMSEQDVACIFDDVELTDVVR